MKSRSRNRLAGFFLAALTGPVLQGCASESQLATVEYVDLQRFMGDWYVIGNIPTFLEKNAYNAVESYRLDDDGTIATTFVFRKGSFDGKRKVYTPRAWVRDTDSNAVWGMQFVWPIKADYRIVYLSSDYSTTIIGRNKRDFVWIMSREPTMDEAEYARLKELAGSYGYDTAEIRRVPQEWPQQ